MILSIDDNGTILAIATDPEEFDLAALGTVTARRASHVEPIDGDYARWTADMTPVNGPVLGPFPTRRAALAAEVAWIETNVL